ncbi:MAG: ribonuclease Y [Bdellovibrionaceae bacterium]|nr:ribonuclease Y [Pseudobdellovibrionaceae bacterium]
MEFVLAAVVGLLIGGAAVFLIKRAQDETQKKSAKAEADRIINRAKSEAQKIDRDSKAKAKDFEARARKNVETDIQKQKSQMKQKEGQLERRLKELDDQHKAKLDDVERFEKSLQDKTAKIEITEKRIEELEVKIEAEYQELREKLSRVSTMTPEEAKREIVQALEGEAKAAAAKRLSEIEAEAEKDADRKAKRIIAVAVSRFASEYTSERTVSVMALPSEEMKGKIIGREGRNIRTLEAMCGVDLIVDDTPEAVVISGFDPVRRELARRTLTKLLEDGRVHPARIEEVVEKVKVELQKDLREEGDKIVVELGLGQMHNEITRAIGSLKFRHSFTQNLLSHSLEVAHLSGLMAAELGVNVKLAKRAGLLHDIGMAIDHTVDGSSAMVGADFCKKYGEPDAVCHAIRAHRGDEPANSALAHIVAAAYQMSVGRPGARRPGMDNFIHRLQELESIGNSFDGVLRTFAVQAGREVRVLVEASKVTDDLAQMLSRDIVRKIEREMPHLGQVKVAVYRETRSVEMAR